MPNRNGLAALAGALLSVALVAGGCSGGDGAGTEASQLAVLGVDPVPSATLVPLNRPIVVTFAASVDPATVTTTTLTLTAGAVQVSGALGATGAVVTFTPGAELSPATAYTLTIRGGAGGVRAVDGAALAADHVSTFTTGTTVIVDTNVDAPTIWKAGRVYLVTGGYIVVNAALTIEPGVVVKLEAGHWIEVGALGQINATGTPASKIVFTSWRDDAHGGDTNRDGAATQPAKGDWWEVVLQSNGSTFRSCEFWYGGSGYGGKSPTLDLGTHYATVIGCTFAYNTGGDLVSPSGALCAGSATISTIISDDVFYGNDLPLTISEAVSVGDTNSFHDPADASRKNTYNAIVYQGLPIANTRTWGETEVPFVVLSSLTVTGWLSVGSAVVVKLSPASTYVDVQPGGNLVVGTGAALTSLRDDTRGGDTNADGAATSPATDDWLGVWVSGVFSRYTDYAYTHYDQFGP